MEDPRIDLQGEPQVSYIAISYGRASIAFRSRLPEANGEREKAIPIGKQDRYAEMLFAKTSSRQFMLLQAISRRILRSLGISQSGE